MGYAERKAAGKLDQYADAANSVMTKEAKSCIIKHSIFGTIFVVFPFFGVETILYAIALWRMYRGVARSMNFKFDFGAVVSGFIVNILVCLVANILLDAVIGLGWLIEAALIFFLTYYSGKAYLGRLYQSRRDG